MVKNILLFLFITVAFSSCGGNIGTDTPSVQNDYLPPTALPLKFSSVKNINPAAIKTINVQPVVKKIGFDKIPVRSYDTSASRPIHYETEETKTGYNNLPVKDFDVNKLPSKALKLIVTKLSPPKLIKCGQPILKNATLSLFDMNGLPGVPGALVTCVFTDKENFLWIATARGLYRYDGENLLSYLEGRLDTIFIGMLEDADGRFWLSTVNGGLAVLDTKKGTFSRTESLADSRNNLAYILQDKQQRIWESSSKPQGVNIVDPNKLTVKWLDGSNGLADASVNGLTIDRSGQLWIATLKGINIINPETKKIKVLSKSNGLKSDSVGALFCDSYGNIWMNDAGINILNPSTGFFNTIENKEFFEKRNPFIGFSEDVNGKIWLASLKNGVGVVDPLKQTLQKIKKVNGLDSNLTLKIAPDKNGQAWVPTLKGLNKIGYANNLVEHIDNVIVNALCEDSYGMVWEGTYGGINVIDRKNKTYRRLNIAAGLFNDTAEYIVEKHGKMFIGSNGGVDIIDSSRSTVTHLGLKEGLHERRINAVMVDKNGNLWLADWHKGIDIYNPANNTVKHIGKEQGLSEQEFTDIKQDKRGNVWVSTLGDIYKITPDLTVIQSVSLCKGIKPLVVDEYDNVWIGSPQGIFVIDKLNQKMVSFSKQQGLADNQLFSLSKYNNRIYAGTLKGVTVIDPPVGTLQTDKTWSSGSFGSRYGLVKTGGSVLTDVITHSGLYCWGDYGVSVYDLSKKDTAVSPVYISGINIMDGHQYFIDNNPTTRKDKLIWDKVVGPYNLPSNLQLPYNQNYVQFNYGVLNLTSHDSTSYRYRLSGEEKKWNSITSLTTSKSYYNLAPGKYTFEVTSKTDNENWGPAAQLPFIINPPWWQTWWAYILYIILFAGTVWGFVHFRSRKLRYDKKLLEEKVNQRTEEVLQQKEEIEAQRDNLEKAFKELKTAQAQLVQSEKMASLGELTAGIAHEIQNPLNFVNNFSEVNAELIDEMQEEIEHGNYEEVKALASDIKQNQEKISQHGKRADFIVKGMLQHSRTNSGERQLTNINTLADEFFKLSYHGLRAKDKSFNAEMTTHFEPNLPKINVIQQDIGRVLLNLFNNAFYAVNEKKKTADKSYRPEVKITTSSADKHVIITVRDNGTGIPDSVKEKIMQPFFTTKPTGEGTGLGLSLTYDMVVKGHGGSIRVDSVEGEGSEFTIALPIN
jgi:signal transduction histidine kinase/ligand-binding sensor domain-containing protein